MMGGSSWRSTLNHTKHDLRSVRACSKWGMPFFRGVIMARNVTLPFCIHTHAVRPSRRVLPRKGPHICTFISGTVSNALNPYYWYACARFCVAFAAINAYRTSIPFTRAKPNLYMHIWYRFFAVFTVFSVLFGLSISPASAADDPTSIADARAQGSGTEVLIEGVVTRAFGAYARIQDDSGDLGASGMMIRQVGGALSDDFQDAIEDGTITEGTILRVEGEISAFNDLLQINGDDLFSYSIEGSDDAPDPLEVTLSELDGNYDYESVLVRVNDVTMQESGTFENNTSYTAVDATGELALRAMQPNETAIGGLLIPSEAFDYEGVVGRFGDVVRLIPVFGDDFVTDEDLTPPDDNGDEDVITIAEAREQASGTVTVEGVVTRARGRLTRIQDDTAGIAVFDPSGDFANSVNQGDEIRVTGDRTAFNEQKQIGSPDDPTILSTGNDLPEELALTLEEINDGGEEFESKLVRVTDITIDTDDSIFRSETNYDIDDGTDIGDLRIQNEGDSGAVGQPIPDEPFTYVGIVSRFGESFQLEPVRASDIRTADDVDLTDALICEIQGTGTRTPLQDEQVTTRENVVTAIANNGFFMQMVTREDDCPDGSSRGLFVFTSSSPSGVEVGDEVEVTGTAEEFNGWTQLGSGASFSVTGTADVPEPVQFDATTPDPGPFDVPDIYQYQSMIVSVDDGIATSATDRFGNFYVDAAGSFDVDRNFRQPGIPYPGEPDRPVWDGNQQLFEIDISPGNFPTSFDDVVFRGASVSAEGPLVFAFDEHVIWPSELTVDNPPEDEVLSGVRDREDGEIVLGTFNLFDLFGPGEGDSTPGGYENRLQKQSAYVCDLMQTPEILGVQESGGQGSLEDLADAIASTCGVTYDAYTGTPDGRGIRNGALVQTSVLNVETEDLGREETLSFSPNQRVHDRAPFLVSGDIEVDGEELPLNVLVIHNRSRIDIEDGNTDFIRGKRFEQARSIAQMVQTIQTDDPAMRVAVLGDFNAFEFTDGYAHVLGELTGDIVPGEQEFEGDPILDRPLDNQVLELDPLDRYSFIFEGAAQVLDHILTNDRLTPLVTDRAYIRANIDAPHTFLSDATTTFSSSDHDAMAIHVDMSAAVTEPVSIEIEQSFEDFTDPNSYRLIGLPGVAGVELDAMFSGTAGISYRVFEDTGEEGSPSDYLTELSGEDRFAAGRGYWALARDAWSVQQDILSVQLSAEGTFDLPLRSGWNILVNPFETEIVWDEVMSDNAVDNPQPLWGFEGGLYSESSTLPAGSTGEAFYFFNDPDSDVRSLTLDPEAQEAAAAATSTTDESRFTLDAYADDEAIGSVELGIGSSARAYVAPRNPFGAASVSISGQEGERPLATHIVEDDGTDGHVFVLSIEGQAGSSIALLPSGISGLDNASVSLMLPDGGSVVLSDDETATFTLSQDTEQLEISVGALEDITDSDAPDELELRGNYPNPFSTETTIEYAIPEEMSVQVEVFNILGQRVATLVDEVQRPGRYDVQWDGRGSGGERLAGGVYIVRITGDGQTKSDRITYVP